MEHSVSAYHGLGQSVGSGAWQSLDAQLEKLKGCDKIFKDKR
jgi:hypothetical protein